MNPESILEKIRKDEIKPIPRRIFIIKRSVAWVVGITATLFGAFTFAKVIASVLISGWEYWDYSFNYFGSFIFSVLPLLWIGCLLVFIAFMPYLVHQTHSGYKYRAMIIILVSVLVSFFLSLVVLKVGSYINTNSIFTNPAVKIELENWSKPQAGRLIGKVEMATSNTSIVRDFNGKMWVVDTTNLLPGSQNVLKNSPIVRIVGIVVGNDVFLACQVLPFDVDAMDVSRVQLSSQDGSKESISPVISDVCFAVLGGSL